MEQIEETPLPGVGIRYSFITDAGQRLSVLHHHSGRHEVFLGEVDDPDASRLLFELTDSDSRVLSELLGASRVVREIDRLQQSVAGLTIEWLTVAAGSDAAGRTIGSLRIRSTTGVTVVAALRSGEALPVPGPDFAIRDGDTVVVMGRPDDIDRFAALVRA